MLLIRGGRRSRVLSGQDLLLAIGLGDGDPSAATEAMTGKDTAIDPLCRLAGHRLGMWPASLPLPSVRSPVASSRVWLSLNELDKILERTQQKNMSNGSRGYEVLKRNITILDQDKRHVAHTTYALVSLNTLNQSPNHIH